MAKKSRAAKPSASMERKKLSVSDVLSRALMTPIVLKSIVVTILTGIFIYILQLLNITSFLLAFISVFIALIVVQEIQTGRKGVEHSAAELAILAVIIAAVIALAKVNLAAAFLGTWQTTIIALVQTLVITFLAIILYLLIVHPTKMEAEYMSDLKSKYLTR